MINRNEDDPIQGAAVSDDEPPTITAERRRLAEEPEEDFDLPDANWVDISHIGSSYQEQIDVSRRDGLHRHRPMAFGGQSLKLWKKGPAPR